MKTNINELNIEDMEMINGGYGIKDFLGDTFAIVIGGPVGEGLVIAKHIATGK